MKLNSALQNQLVETIANGRDNSGQSKVFM